MKFQRDDVQEANEVDRFSRHGKGLGLLLRSIVEYIMIDARVYILKIMYYPLL